MRSVLILATAACGRIGFGEAVVPDDGATLDGPTTTFAPTWQSGSRLRARTIVGTDGGDPIFVGWHDTLMQTDCQSYIMADGVERCVPVEVVAAKHFADAACSTAVGVVRATRRCGQYRFAFLLGLDGRGHVFPFGAPHTGTVYDVNEGCTPTSNVGSAYVLGPETPPDMFLATRYENVPVGDYLQIRIGFSDGSWSMGPSLHRGDGSECQPGLQPPGSAACVPLEDTVVEAVYADAACTQRAFFWDRGASDVPDLTVMMVEEQRACSRSATAYDVVAALAQTTYYVRTLGACVARTRVAEDRLYTGAERAPFPVGTMAATTGAGRVGSLVWLGPDGVRLPQGAYDRELGLPCRHFVARDGVLRCLPRFPRTVRASTDAACGTVQELAAACHGTPPLAGPSYASCEDQLFTDVVAFDARFATAYVDDETCTELEMPGGAYQVPSGGSALAPSSFPEVVEIIE